MEIASSFLKPSPVKGVEGLSGSLPRWVINKVQLVNCFLQLFLEEKLKAPGLNQHYSSKLTTYKGDHLEGHCSFGK